MNVGSPKPAALPRLAMNYREAGQLIGVCEKTVYLLVKQGRIKVLRIGRTVRITTAAIEQFIRENEVSEVENVS